MWEQSAKQGLVDAQASMGDVYRLGSKDGPPMTIPVDPQLSFRWMLAAAKQEHVESMMRIGEAYYTGRGVEKNDDSAFEWTLKAGKTGDSRSQFVVGYFYENGRGVEVDLDEAMHWYQKSAAQGVQTAIDGVERLSNCQ